MCKSEKAKENSEKRSLKDYYQLGCDIMWKAWQGLLMVKTPRTFHLVVDIMVCHEYDSLLKYKATYAAGLSSCNDDGTGGKITLTGYIRKGKLDCMEQVLGHEILHLLHVQYPDDFISTDDRW